MVVAIGVHCDDQREPFGGKTDLLHIRENRFRWRGYDARIDQNDPVADEKILL